MSDIRISFGSSDAEFLPADRPAEEHWIDTSFANAPSAIGSLRLPAVSNGRYERKHPILNAQGETTGFMVDGERSLGYTFACVYSGDCFWVSHQGFGATMSGGDISTVSIVDKTGHFMFSNSIQFKASQSFGCGRSWVNSIQAFKLLDDAAYLLYLTSYGVCMFNVRRREIVAKAEFTNLAYQCSGFALSPKL